MRGRKLASARRARYDGEDIGILGYEYAARGGAALTTGLTDHLDFLSLLREYHGAI